MVIGGLSVFGFLQELAGARGPDFERARLTFQRSRGNPKNVNCLRFRTHFTAILPLSPNAQSNRINKPLLKTSYCLYWGLSSAGPVGSCLAQALLLGTGRLVFQSFCCVIGLHGAASTRLDCCARSAKMYAGHLHNSLKNDVFPLPRLKSLSPK